MIIFETTIYFMIANKDFFKIIQPNTQPLN